MRSTSYGQKKIVAVAIDTWKKLWDIKIKYDKPNLDTVIYESVSIYEMILELADKYRMDPLLLVKEMVIFYDDYLRDKYIRSGRRGL